MLTGLKSQRTSNQTTKLSAQLGMGKKKKASNPARGFSTTSIPSKKTQSRPDDNTELVPNLSNASASKTSNAEEALPATTVEVRHDPNTLPKSGSEGRLGLTKEALQTLLQSINSQHSRVISDYRIARSSGRVLKLGLWFSPELEEYLIQLCRRSLTENLLCVSLMHPSGQSGSLKVLWSIWHLLRRLGFSPEDVYPSLKWLSHTVSLELATLQNFPLLLTLALEFLALNTPNLSPWVPHMFYRQPKPGGTVSLSKLSLDSTPEQTEKEDRNSPIQTNSSSVATVHSVSSDDEVFTDSDSEMKPEELVPRWVDLNAQLLEAEFGLSRQMLRKPAARLKRQMLKIERDVLFDSKTAAWLWEEKKKEVYQRRQWEAAFSNPNQTIHSSSLDENECVNNNKNDDEDQDQDEVIDLFDLETHAEAALSTEISSFRLRDYQTERNSTNESPFSLLTRLVQSLEPSARVEIKSIPRLTGICQSEITIESAKVMKLIGAIPFKSLLDSNIETVSNTLSFQMKDCFCPTTFQSHSYISTLALACLVYFQALSSKCRLQLLPPWNHLFDEATSEVNQTVMNLVEDEMTIIQDIIKPSSPCPTPLQANVLPSKASGSTKSFLTPSSNPNSKPSLSQSALKQLWHRYSQSDTFRRMERSRSTLPVHQFKSQILQIMEEQSILLISGEPGCGKSTQVPAYILEHELSQGRECKIMCTQPRRISAISLATRVRQELGDHPPTCERGPLVGYSVRFDSDTSPDSRIVYSTVGILFRMLEKDGKLSEVTHLVIDEVHERNLDTDFLLLIVRQIRATRPDLKIVLMSATVDANKFSAYMGNCPVLFIPGRTFPVSSYFLEDAIEMSGFVLRDDRGLSGRQDNASSTNSLGLGSGIPSDFPGYSSETMRGLLAQNEYTTNDALIVHLIKYVSDSTSKLFTFSTCFLVFLPGLAEIKSLRNKIINDSYFDNRWRVHILHSSVPSESQQAVFKTLLPGERKLVLSTNIAETGITIPDVTCVIDSGKHKEMRYDEKRQSSRLIEAFVSQANADQRRGRAGRVQEGICFHLYTSHRYKNLLPAFQTPESVRLSLKDIICRVSYYGLGSIGEVLTQLLDPPSGRRVQQAVRALVESNIISLDEKLTLLGASTLKLPLDAHLSKLCIFSALVQCLDFGITIAALLSLSSIVISGTKTTKPSHGREETSDIISLYHIYQSWRSSVRKGEMSSEEYCQKNDLHHQRLVEAEEVKYQLLMVLSEMGLSGITPSKARSSRQRTKDSQVQLVESPPASSSNVSNPVLLASLTAWAFYPNILVRSENGTWKSLSNSGATVQLHPSSVLYPKQPSSPFNKPAQFLSYYYIHSSSDGSSSHARYTTQIDPVALSVFLPHFSPSSTRADGGHPAVPSLVSKPHDPVQFNTAASFLSVRPIGGSLKLADSNANTAIPSSSPMVLRFALSDVPVASRLHALRTGWNLALKHFLEYRPGKPGPGGPQEREVKNFVAANGLGIPDRTAAEFFDLAMGMFRRAQEGVPVTNLVVEKNWAD